AASSLSSDYHECCDRKTERWLRTSWRGGAASRPLATGPALLVARYFKPLISEPPSARNAVLARRVRGINRRRPMIFIRPAGHYAKRQKEDQVGRIVVHEFSTLDGVI